MQGMRHDEVVQQSYAHFSWPSLASTRSVAAAASEAQRRTSSTSTSSASMRCMASASCSLHDMSTSLPFERKGSGLRHVPKIDRTRHGRSDYCHGMLDSHSALTKRAQLIDKAAAMFRSDCTTFRHAWARNLTACHSIFCACNMQSWHCCWHAPCTLIVRPEQIATQPHYAG